MYAGEHNTGFGPEEKHIDRKKLHCVHSTQQDVHLATATGLVSRPLRRPPSRPLCDLSARHVDLPRPPPPPPPPEEGGQPAMSEQRRRPPSGSPRRVPVRALLLDQRGRPHQARPQAQGQAVQGNFLILGSFSKPSFESLFFIFSFRFPSPCPSPTRPSTSTSRSTGSGCCQSELERHVYPRVLALLITPFQFTISQRVLRTLPGGVRRDGSHGKN